MGFIPMGSFSYSGVTMKKALVELGSPLRDTLEDRVNRALYEKLEKGFKRKVTWSAEGKLYDMVSERLHRYSDAPILKSLYRYFGGVGGSLGSLYP